ncbi:MAG TPA: T9SS type A sorting domain-containing protein, partial [Balneolales bacterium]|nr:T9SS type A sorting domain-containing protein [Balneolales bacterium]
YGFPLNVNFDFDVIKDGTRLTNLTLAANKSFGFTRLVNTNGVWLSDPDYEVNLSQSSDHNYTSNTIISNQTFADGDPLYIGDNITVMLEGNVSISNTTVYLGKDAYLKVSGSLTADNVVFTSNNPDDASKRYAWVELDGSSEIENCTFTGGQIGLVQQAGTNNYARNSTFTQNNVGIRTSGGTIKLEACHINNNTSDGLQVWGAHVYTDQIFTAGQTLSWKRTHITQNDGHGIDVKGAGTLDLRYTEVSGNGTDEIVVRNGGWLYAGVTQPYIYDGYNTFANNSGYYLKSLAYTTDGETYINNTVWAQMNYWSGSTPSSKIYGDVRWDPVIDQDSTVDHSSPAYGMNNQNIEAAVNLQEAAPTNVLTMATTDQIVSDTTNGFTADELLWAKQRMMDLKEAIAKAPNDRWNIRRVQEWYHLARRYDVKNKWGERTGVNKKLEDWQEQMETWSPLSLTQSGALQTNNLTGGSASIDNKLNANIQQAKTVQLMGEASLLLSVDELLSDGKVKEALNRSNRVISKLENKDSKSILYAYQLKGWQQLGRYDSAYAALERIKAISPDAGMTSKVTDADFVSQEKWLLYLMKEHNQGVTSASAPTIAEKSVQSTDSNLPKVFALDANYPNPFNPTTTIPISLPKAAHVKVEVYNVAGQLVATLTNKDYQAGRYQLRFDAHMLASGMYLVRAHLGGKVFTRKLTLIK